MREIVYVVRSLLRFASGLAPMRWIFLAVIVASVVSGPSDAGLLALVHRMLSAPGVRLLVWGYFGLCLELPQVTS